MYIHKLKFGTSCNFCLVFTKVIKNIKSAHYSYKIFQRKSTFLERTYSTESLFLQIIDTFPN